MTVTSFSISDRVIGPGQPPFVVAELGINHGGDLATARRMLISAAEAGADAVKLQTFRTQKFLARSSEYFEVLRGAELPTEAVAELMQLSAEKGVVLFSAVFDEDSADLLESLDAPAYKIASGDLTHLPLLRHVASVGKPMIISTGGSTLTEIDSAFEAVRTVNKYLPIALLHCVSNYPTDSAETNLACMATMRDRWQVPVGFSDHTLGNVTAIAAAALGAELIEKHFTLDRSAPGPDHALSADPAGFADLVNGVRTAQSTIGRREKAPVEDRNFIPQFRRGVTADLAIPAGTVVTRNMLAIKRPGTGIEPDRIDDVVGCTAGRDIAADETLQWEMLNERR